MKEQDIERIRGATFALSRRGYEQREVDQFLAELADWLESGALEAAGSFAVQRKLERAGETAGRMLGAAEQESEQLLREARDEAKRLVSEANVTARAAVEAAREKATRTVGEGDARRESIEKLIQSLVLTRDGVLQELDQLGRRLATATAEGRPEPGKDPYATPAILDPAERGSTTPPSRRERRATGTPTGSSSPSA